jgi:threonine-phosphate decarboxylase
MALLERYGHGGDLMTAAELYGRSSFIDFSSNLFPYGPPLEIGARFREWIAEDGFPLIARYPDPAARKLAKLIACMHGVHEENVLVGNGAAELFDLLVQIRRPRRVGVIEPAFREYADCAKKRGIPVESLVTRRENGFLPDEWEAIRLVNRTDLVFVGSPNNPTGHLVPTSILESMAEEAGRSGSLLVVDEAFLDFVENGETVSMIRRLDHFPGLVVVRSLTKFYALAGLRLGYLVAVAATVKELKRIKTPWSVNGLAQAVGEVILEQSVREPFARRVFEWLKVERLRLADGLSALGLEVFPGQANYLLVRLSPSSGKTAPWLQEELGRRGILIRDCSMYPGLDEHYFRLAVRKPEENAVLLKIMEEVLRKEG